MASAHFPRTIMLIGLIGFINPIGAFAAGQIDGSGGGSSSSFTANDSLPAIMGGGLQTSGSFQNIGAAGQAVGGDATSASFLNQIGTLFFNPANPGTLSVSTRASAYSTDPMGRSDFILSYASADPNGKLFMACYGESQADVEANCVGQATRAFTSDTTHTFTELKRNTTYYFRVYPLSGYDASGDPIIGPTATATVSGTHNSIGLSGVGGGSGSGGGGGGGAVAPAPAPASVPAPSGEVAPISVIRRIGEAVGLVQPSLEVPEEAPPGLAGNLPFVPEAKLEQFVFGSLPKEIIFLLKQFPDLRRTFSEVGVERAGDIIKLGKTKFDLPTVSELAELSLSSGVPVAQFSKNMVKNMPKEIMFVRAPHEQVDVNTVLVFDRDGKPQQLMNVTAGASVKLVVRPDQPASRVDGYIIRNQKEIVESPRVPTRSLAASLIMANASVAEPAKKINKKLLLKEFRYKRNNNVFEADVTMPGIRGEFEVTTVIIYKDKRLPATAINLVAVVDPEGYVYEQTARGKIRIEGATTALHQCPPDFAGGELDTSYWSDTSDKCPLWDGARYSQKNPQTTNEDGEYSFLTPPGKYYISAEAAGYEKFIGEPFVIGDDNFVKLNIALSRGGVRSWFKKMFEL